MSVHVPFPGQTISTRMSRGNESIEIVSLSGSALTSISVSEREGVFLPSSIRWSYPITSAVAGWPGSGVSSFCDATFTSVDFGPSAFTVSWA